MSQEGKIQLVFTIVAPQDLVAQGDRIFEAYAKWMETTHHRNPYSVTAKMLPDAGLASSPEVPHPT